MNPLDIGFPENTLICRFRDGHYFIFYMGTIWSSINTAAKELNIAEINANRQAEEDGDDVIEDWVQCEICNRWHKVRWNEVLSEGWSGATAPHLPSSTPHPPPLQLTTFYKLLRPSFASPNNAFRSLVAAPDICPCVEDRQNVHVREGRCRKALQGKEKQGRGNDGESEREETSQRWI